mgnify:CR=1 FL=1
MTALHLPPPPQHGGRRREAAQRYGIPLEQWLDLSTGINPRGYPVPNIPAEAWAFLPEDGDGLESAAAQYYGTHAVLPVAGSQAAIQALPRLLKGRRVTIASPTYAEHAHAWRDRAPQPVPFDQFCTVSRDADIAIVVHPNNPTAETLPTGQLLDLHRQLAARGGTLIIDEAFADPSPGIELTRPGGVEGLVVLRSLGKFFGLAGARVGFVIAPERLRTALGHLLGPWPIAGPARFVARQALLDTVWQDATRQRLHEDAGRLSSLLQRLAIGTVRGCALFQQIETPHAAALHHHLAGDAILVRLFSSPSCVRFGLPGTSSEWMRLERALDSFVP